MDHTEPYSAGVLYRWLQREGASIVAQKGSHCTLMLPNGRAVGCPDPGSNHTVATDLAGRVAIACGLTLIELRSRLGYQSGKGNATRAKPISRVSLSAAQSEMFTRIKRAAGLCIDSGILPSQRAYMHQHLPGLLSEIERIASVK